MRVAPIAVLVTVSIFSVIAGSSRSSAAPPAMIEFFALGKTQQGVPILDVASELVVLGRDGWMHSLDPRDPEIRVRKTDQPYEAISAPELRNQLRAEFGRSFEVIATKNFLVVQPQGRGDRWPRLFEQSHRGFTTYMNRRGVTVRSGRFPMVAVVMPDEAAMYREFKKLDIDMSRVAGVYSGMSNRVITHDGGRFDAIAATVRHEAAHQSAYNAGVHSRLCETPRWTSEGIGQMFEPAGMTDVRTATRISDRMNRESVSFIQQNFDGRGDVAFSETVMQLVSDDAMFNGPSEVSKAYAVSWAMMFYLAEREPERFAQWLNFTSNRPPFRAYPRRQRVDDFERIMGCDTFELSRKVAWFVASL